MYKLLRYFYFVLYKFSLSNNEKDPFTPYWIIMLFNIANFLEIIGGIVIITKIKYPASVSKLTLILIALIIFYCMYLLLVKGDKPKKILEEFSNASKREKIWLNIFLILYIVLSVGLVIYTGNIIRSGSYLK